MNSLLKYLHLCKISRANLIFHGPIPQFTTLERICGLCIRSSYTYLLKIYYESRKKHDPSMEKGASM